jgi:hypothetical protein
MKTAKTVVKVMFKHEGHDDDGRAVGPVWVQDEGAEEYRNFRDSDEPHFIAGKFFAAWFDLATARLIAGDLGVTLEEG